MRGKDGLGSGVEIPVDMLARGRMSTGISVALKFFICHTAFKSCTLRLFSISTPFHIPFTK